MIPSEPALAAARGDREERRGRRLPHRLALDEACERPLRLERGREPVGPERAVDVARDVGDGRCQEKRRDRAREERDREEDKKRDGRLDEAEDRDHEVPKDRVPPVPPHPRHREDARALEEERDRDERPADEDDPPGGDPPAGRGATPPVRGEERANVLHSGDSSGR